MADRERRPNPLNLIGIAAGFLLFGAVVVNYAATTFAPIACDCRAGQPPSEVTIVMLALGAICFGILPATIISTWVRSRGKDDDA